MIINVHDWLAHITAPCSNFNGFFHETNHIFVVHLLEVLITVGWITQNGEIFLGHQLSLQIKVSWKHSTQYLNSFCMKQMGIKRPSLMFVCVTANANGITSCSQLPGLAYTKCLLPQWVSHCLRETAQILLSRNHCTMVCESCTVNLALCESWTSESSIQVCPRNNQIPQQEWLGPQWVAPLSQGMLHFSPTKEGATELFRWKNPRH